jgi:hypothetical protein
MDFRFTLAGVAASTEEALRLQLQLSYNRPHLQ